MEGWQPPPVFRPYPVFLRYNTHAHPWAPQPQVNDFFTSSPFVFLWIASKEDGRKLIFLSFFTQDPISSSFSRNHYRKSIFLSFFNQDPISSSFSRNHYRKSIFLSFFTQDPISSYFSRNRSRKSIFLSFFQNQIDLETRSTLSTPNDNATIINTTNNNPTKLKNFNSITFIHTYRLYNSRADANKAMDDYSINLKT